MRGAFCVCEVGVDGENDGDEGGGREGFGDVLGLGFSEVEEEGRNRRSFEWLGSWAVGLDIDESEGQVSWLRVS